MKEVVGVRKIFMLFVMILLSFTFIKTEALILDKSEVSVVKGQQESVSLSINVEEEIQNLEFSLVFSTYDIPAKFVVSGEHTSSVSGITNKVNFATPISGNINLGTIDVSVVSSPSTSVGYINLTGVKATTTGGTVINLNAGTITVNVLDETVVETEEETTTKVVDVKKEVLKSIESNIVDIKLKDDIYEYTVNVENDVQELDLKPILIDNTYKVEVSNQNLVGITNKKITITLTKNKDKKVYTINVKKDVVVTKDDSEEVPEFKYKGKLWIAAAIFVVLLVCGIGLSKKK